MAYMAATAFTAINAIASSSITFRRHAALVSLPQPLSRRPPTFFTAHATAPSPPWLALYLYLHPAQFGANP